VVLVSLFYWRYIRKRILSFDRTHKLSSCGSIRGDICHWRDNSNDAAYPKSLALFHNPYAALGSYRHRFSAHRVYSRSSMAGPPRWIDGGTNSWFLLPPAGTAEITSSILPLLILIEIIRADTKTR